LEYVDWIILAPNGDNWQPPLNMAMMCRAR